MSGYDSQRLNPESGVCRRRAGRAEEMSAISVTAPLPSSPPPPPRDAGAPVPRQIWPPPDHHASFSSPLEHSPDLRLVVSPAEARTDASEKSDPQGSAVPSRLPDAAVARTPAPSASPPPIILVPPPPLPLSAPAPDAASPSRLHRATRIEKISLPRVPAAAPDSVDTPPPAPVQKPAARPAPGLLRLDPALADASAHFWNHLLQYCRGISPRRLLIASLEPAAGVSVIAAALALHVARLDGKLRVLLADFNLRRPALAPLFGASPVPGIAELLDGRASLADALATVELGEHAAPASLALLPAGLPRGGGGPREPVLRSLLDDASDRFDLVLLDAGTLHGNSLLDPLARAADAAAIVVRPGRTWRDAIDVARRQLASAGITRVGLVVNRPE